MVMTDYGENHCKIFGLVVRKDCVGEVYNIDGHNEKKNIEIKKIVCKEFGKSESLITYLGHHKGHNMRCAIQPRFTMNLGYRKSNLGTASRKLFSGITIIESDE